MTPTFVTHSTNLKSDFLKTEAMSDDVKGTTQTYFHYTDKDSASKIEESGLIKKSTADSAADDAVLGDGVYTTQAKPSNYTYDIAKNNYDDDTSLPEQKINEGKLDYVVQINMDSAKMQDCSEISGRDIHLYQDKDLDLKGKDVKSYDIYPRT